MSHRSRACLQRVVTVDVPAARCSAAAVAAYYSGQLTLDFLSSSHLQRL